MDLTAHRLLHCRTGATVIETHSHDRAPGKGPQEWGGGHLDVQLTRSDFEATPRRDQASIWLWVVSMCS